MSSPTARRAGSTAPGAVDVVHAPATEPGAVRPLFSPQVVEGAAHGRKGSVIPQEPNSSRMCAVTSSLGGSMTSPKSQKGMPVTIRRVLSTSKQAPASRLLGLHAEQPLQAALQRRPLRRSSGTSRAGQRTHHLGRVVGIGVEVVGELERPAAGGRVRLLHLPVAAGQRSAPRVASERP